MTPDQHHNAAVGLLARAADEGAYDEDEADRIPLLLEALVHAVLALGAAPARLDEPAIARPLIAERYAR